MESSWTRYINGFFWILFSAIAILFFIIQYTLYDPFSYRNHNIEPIVKDAVAILPDGTRKPIGVFNDCYDYEVNKNEVAAIEVVLPQIEDYSRTISLLSNEQTISLYIDGELRENYDDQVYHILNNNSSSCMLSMYVTPEDSNKTLRIEYKTSLKDSARILSCVYYCTEMEFFSWVLSKAVNQLISGIILTALGALLVIIGFYFKILGKNDRGLAPLGLYSLLIAAWLLLRCNLRGFYLKHIGSAESISYFILMLAPVPILMFFNLLFKYEYQKLYSIETVILILNLAISGILELLGIVNVIEISTITQVFIFMVCFTCLYTITNYTKKYHLENGTFIDIGVVGFMIATITEDIRRQFFKEQFVGRFVGTGMLFFLLMIAYSTIKNLAIQEQELQDAVRQNGIKNAFLANMSHEIRTPINTIMGMDEMILRESEDDDITHYATNIANASRSLLSLVDDILDYSKIEAGRMEIVTKRYNLVRVLIDMIDSTSIRTIQKNLRFEFNVNEDIPALLIGDEIRMRQILNNILTNAVKYTKEGSVSFLVDYIQLAEDEIELTFSVVDTGIGIKDEDKERLFDSFVRLEQNKNRNIEGTGLGMAITKQIVEMLGGSIEVKSEYGVGSNFIFKLRQKVSDSTPVGNISKYRKLVTAGNNYVEMYKATDLRILVVDDNEMNMEVIKGLLKNTEAKIDTAISGIKCLELLKSNIYDLILLDHMMPEMDGLETLEKIRLLPGRASITPIIALTANSVSGAKEEYIRKGFADYLSKPVDYKELVKIIEKYAPDKFVRTETEVKKNNTNVDFLENNGIHVNGALKYSGDDINQYKKMLEIFISSKSMDKKRELHDFYIEEDWKNYLIAVHSLKNSARTIGADDLADMAYEHEMQTKAEDYDFVRDNFYDLDSSWSKVLEIVETYVNEYVIIDQTGNTVNNSIVMSDKDKREYIDTIVELIDTFKRGEAVNLIEDIIDYDWEEDDRKKLQEAVKLIKSYEYEMAIEMLRGIV